MRNLTAVLCTLALFANACAPSKSDPSSTDKETNSVDVADGLAYDSLLAKKLDADDYGMKSYVMAFLKVGPNRSQNAEEAAALQRAHLDNITRMADEGTLVLAGPFIDNGDLRGIYLFNVATVEEAEVLTKTDPMIQSGRLIFEFHPWYGSAAIPLLNDWHKRVAKMDI